MKRKLISAILVLCLVFSLSASALAAEITPSADKTSVEAGSDVTVTLRLDEDILDVATISYVLRYNASLFGVKSSEAGATLGVVVSDPMSDTTGDFLRISYLDSTSEGVTMNKGVFATIVFTAKADITANQNANFTLSFKNGQDKDGNNITHTAGTAASVTVTPKAADPEYTLTMGEDITANVDDEVTIPVTVGYTTEEVKSFNAVDMQFAYDAAKLEFISVSDTKNYTVNQENGVVRVQGYGEDKALGEAFTLTFSTKEATDEDGTLVTVQSAKVDEAKNAIAENAPEAKLLRGSTKITISAVYTVTLPDGFTGETTVGSGKDYTFTAEDTVHYDYSYVTATVGGEIATVRDNGDGTYTIENVTGDVVVSGKATPKSYTVTVDGTGKNDVNAAATATYGTLYTFTVNKEGKYNYAVSVKIGSTTYTPAEDDGVYTIQGDKVDGNIFITVTKTIITVETVEVSFSGTGAADVKYGTPQTATKDQDFQFELEKDSNYEYTVKLGDEVLTAGTDDKYTIPADKLTEDLTVTVEKTFSAQNVNVQKYVNLDDTSIWLVSVSGTAGDGKVFTYDNASMYTSTKYAESGTHVYLVIAQQLTAEDAAKNVAVANGSTVGTVDYSGDVNGSGTVDINDAQLVYDMYNAKYANFDAATMYKFLCADVSDSTPEGATLLNVNDAVVVVGNIK